MIGYIEDCAEELLDRFQSFSLWDVDVFKNCCILFGMLLGMHIGSGCKSFLKPFVWMAFLATYVYVMWRLFLDPYGYDTCGCCCGEWDEDDED